MAMCSKKGFHIKKRIKKLGLRVPALPTFSIANIYFLKKIKFWLVV